MKKIEALVSVESLEAIQIALVGLGIPDLSVFEGGQFEESRDQSGQVVYAMSPRAKLEIFCEDHDAARVAQAISVGASSREKFPARVFTSPVEESVKMRPSSASHSAPSSISEG